MPAAIPRASAVCNTWFEFRLGTLSELSAVAATISDCPALSCLPLATTVYTAVGDNKMHLLRMFTNEIFKWGPP